MKRPFIKDEITILIIYLFIFICGTASTISYYLGYNKINISYIINKYKSFLKLSFTY